MSVRAILIKGGKAMVAMVKDPTVAQAPTVRRSSLDPTVRRRAMAYLRAYRKRQAEYEAECAAYRAEGYTPHYCIHGTNRWTDYDNICGYCEDGYSVFQLSLWRAQSDVRESKERFDWLCAAPKGQLDLELRDRLIDWCLVPLKDN